MRSKLRQGEEVILVVEKHWIILIKPAIAFLIGAIITTYMLVTGVANAFFWPIAGTAAFLALIFWMKYKERQLDLWIVTSDRILDEEGLFSLNVKETPLDKINNIKYNQDLIGRMMNFGDVEIMSAASQGETLNKYVSHPKDLYNAVVNSQAQYKQVIDERQRNQPRVMSADEMECPRCAEFIRKKAIVCKHCHYNLADGTMPIAAISPTLKQEVQVPSIQPAVIHPLPISGAEHADSLKPNLSQAVIEEITTENTTHKAVNPRAW